MKMNNVVVQRVNELFILYMIMSLTVFGYYGNGLLTLMMYVGGCVLCICLPLMPSGCPRVMEYPLYFGSWIAPMIHVVYSNGSEHVKTMCIATIATVIIRWRIEDQRASKRDEVLRSIYHAHKVFTEHTTGYSGFHCGERVMSSRGLCWVGSCPGQHIKPGHLPIMMFDPWDFRYIFDTVPVDDVSLYREIDESDDDQDDELEKSFGPCE